MTQPPAPNVPSAQDLSKILDFISRCDDAVKLRLLIKNAKAQNNGVVESTAFRRLIALVPSAQPGSVEHDFWQTIHAFEESLSEERGKTTRLMRTRQKVQRVGVVKTLQDWAVDKKETDGFAMLLARGMPEMTGEAIVLRHPAHFDEETRAKARTKLENAKVDISSLPGT